MVKIKYDINVMKFISLFESLTGANLKDCFLKDNIVYFIAQEDQIGLALGRKGSNIRRLEQVLNRKIKILEFNPQLEKFIKNIIFPLKVEEISVSEGDSRIVTLMVGDTKTRGLLIGKSARNLRNYESLAKRYFKIDEIKVV